MGLAPSPLTPIMEAKAVCCSFSSPNRMNPYPLLNPLLSRTTMDENQGKIYQHNHTDILIFLSVNYNSISYPRITPNILTNF